MRAQISVSGVAYSKNMIGISRSQNGIRTIVFPATVQVVRQAAFSLIASLRSAVLNEGLKVLGTDEYPPNGKQYSGVFEASGLKKVRIPSTLRVLEYSAFRNCKSLKRVSLPDGLQYVGMFCFCGSGLESIALPQSVRHVGNWAFYDCESLRSASLNEGLQTLGSEDNINGHRYSKGVFSKSALESVTIPSTLRTIEKMTFSDCQSLTTV